MRYLLFPLLILFVACGDDDVALPQVDPYSFQAPEHFPPATYDFTRNPVTEAGFKLGKRLFNDPRISSDNSVACSSCHAQGVAFADPQHRLSLGVNDRIGTRNAPPLFNLAFYNEFFWDGGVAHMDFIPLNAIESPLEMDNELSAVVEFLSGEMSYQQDFQAAFQEDTITTALMLQALAQYTAMLVSAGSKYDEVELGNGSFDPAEERGLAIFRRECASCHSEPLFTNLDYADNGLDLQPLDPGRELITSRESDHGRFRVPSLRNINRTAPYMHDGRFNTLEEVVDHYRTGIQSSPNLAPALADGISLNEAEKADLIIFLETLTDWEFLTDERL